MVVALGHVRNQSVVCQKNLNVPCNEHNITDILVTFRDTRIFTRFVNLQAGGACDWGGGGGAFLY